MAANIITAEDLEQFKWELLDNIKRYLDKREEKKKPAPEEKTWIKSHQVQRMLGISPGTLQTLRLNGTIPYSKVGGVLFYNKADIVRLLEENMRNRLP
ncbi:MAG: helix-turn-helix domain-containing protein [Bacteroidetes bacterium]|nr:MAG: helix-turn-helix domain-containing protein [Bacteroidota bacterium]